MKNRVNRSLCSLNCRWFRVVISLKNYDVQYFLHFVNISATDSFNLLRNREKIFFSRSNTSMRVRANFTIFNVNSHAKRWLKTQMIDNSMQFEFRIWKQTQNNANENEMKNYIEKMLNENDVAIDFVFDEKLNNIEKNDDDAMQYLLNNKRFIFEKSKLQKFTIFFIKQILDILFSRLRETNFTSLDVSNSDSDDFMRHIQFHVFTNSFEIDDVIIDVFRNRSTREISDFILRLTIWAEIKNITKQNYAILKKILSLFTMSKMNDFSQSLSILFSWKKTKLSLSSLLKFKIFIKFSKMLSNIYEFHVDMYHIDSRYIVVSLLNVSEINKKMHFDMTNIVKNFFQFWHSNCWIFNIRICFSNFASYDDDNFIIFSDFVRFWNLTFDRVISFDRDRRRQSRTKNKIIFFVQRVWSLFAIDQRNCHDLILLKNDIVDFEFSIVERASYMTIKRIFEFVFQIFKIRRVYNRDSQKSRFVNQFRALRKKLEMKYYDREILVKKFHVNVLFLLFTCFIDDFDLYRNMYRNLCDIYFTSTTLNLKKRQRTRNLYSIIFEFHDSKLNDVVRFMTKRFSMLKKNCSLMINEEKKQIWALILIFTNDIKSQQKVANFFDFNAKFFVECVTQMRKSKTT